MNDTNTTTKLGVLPLEQMRRLSDSDLLAYAEAIGDDEAAWDEISERGCDRVGGAA